MSNYSEADIFSIIMQILSVFEYLHANHFIYRDLRPDNIMIDITKTAVLIDFDRMLNENGMSNDNEVNNTNNYTNDFSTDYIAPEINSGKFTNKCDIYSIGKIINFFIKKRNFKFSIKQIIDLCLSEEQDKRPTVSEIISILLGNADKNNQFELCKCFNSKYSKSTI